MGISIIITVYNGEKYLRECVESVISQTRKPFELILVDDGSNDDSGRICDEYKEKYSFAIRILHIHNQGALLARRIGFQASQGDYILFVDADDMLREDAVESLEEIINLFDYDIVLFDYSLKPEFSGNINIYAYLRNGENSVQDLYREIMQLEMNFLWNKCFKRELFDINNDYTNYPRITKMNDLMQLLPILDDCKNCYYLKEVLYFHRNNKYGITNTYRESDFTSIKQVLEIAQKYSAKWKKEVNKLKTQTIACIVCLNSIKNGNLEYYEKLNKFQEIVNDEIFKEVRREKGFKKRKIKTQVYIMVIIAQVRVYELVNRILRKGIE